jgi:RNA-directed DNA polymerase
VVGVLRANQQMTTLDLSDEDLDFIRKIVCLKDVLAIGAPTSPFLANAIMFEFDVEWSKRTRDQGITYTRYADDLYFSTNHPNVLRETLASLTQYLGNDRLPKLRVNDAKTTFSSRKRRKIATGLVLTSDRKVSVGRTKKRVLKSWVNKLRYRELNPQEIARLRGWISYLHSVEPTFVVALQRKYKLDFEADATWKVER